MRPVTFAGCFGWLHGLSGSLGVVMCASWAYEAAAINQSWRVLADRLAEAGLPTLQFDYFGLGDSLGDGSDGMNSAFNSIAAAVEALKAEAGVTRVALVGLRLGASFALMASERLDVEAVAMIRPVTRGKGFLAEQRALQRILQTRENAAIVRDDDPGALEIEGFRLSPAALGEITGLDLTKLSGKGPKRALIAGEPGSKQYEALAASLSARAIATTRIDLGEVAGWAPAPAPTPPPLADCAKLAAWLKGEAAATPLRSEEAGLRGEGFVESALRFGPEQGLSGILCRPDKPRTGEKAVIFLNTGANSHIGAGRAAVFYARTLAAVGVTSLRMDIIGIGDAAWTGEGPLSAIHQVERTADVSAAIDALRAIGYEKISLVGLCSGGFLAFQSALADSRVDRILVANPQFWFPPTAEQLADPLNGAYGSSSGYAAKLLNPVTWKRLVNGELRASTLKGIGRALFERGVGKGRNLAARLLKSADGDRGLAGQLSRLKARGCEVTLVLSEGDPAIATLEALAPGGNLRVFDGLMRIVVARGADHAFVMTRTRGEFFGLICEAFCLRAPRTADEKARIAA